MTGRHSNAETKAEVENPMSLSTALISVDVVTFQVINGQLMLLVKESQGTDGKPLYMLPAGRIEPRHDQSLDDAAERQLRMYSQQTISHLEQVETLGSPDRDSRGWSLTVVYLALLSSIKTSGTCQNTRWIKVTDGTPDMPLAYDHNKLVRKALDRLKNKIQYSSLPVYLLPEEFTLSDIQTVFAAVLEKTPPMRSIRNRFLKEDLLIDTGHQRRGSNRPAALYKVNKNSQTWLFDRLYLSTQ
ncbi:NUDIX hydrolase [Endozoicomonas arenosclerae]|uniref:NUDIX hydrolase n=1 Tax=Endozoicomonas arenosclerae TaxID=1633495 RepID=UPI0007867F30|nr:NUDIX hydrolase [Endozoicomonas arenosclerae]